MLLIVCLLSYRLIFQADLLFTGLGLLLLKRGENLLVLIKFYTKICEFRNNLKYLTNKFELYLNI
jgi:hypothetical protein